MQKSVVAPARLATFVAACFLSSITLLQTALPAHAREDGDNARKRPAVLRVDYDQIESIGLYETPSDGNLGRDLWDKSRRSFLVEMIPNIPAPNPKSFTHQRMVAGLLLSQSNAALIDNDIDAEPGMDIFTLRMNHLLRMGAYKQAFDMYAKLGEEPYHPSLAKAGILSMLYNGERSLACLEYKTMEDRDFTEEFWTDIALYCDYALSEGNAADARAALAGSNLQVLKDIAANSQYKVAYSGQRLGAMSDTERAILVAENRINWPEISGKLVATMPMEHLGILIARKALKNPERFVVMSGAANRGLVSNTMLRGFYSRVFDEELRQRENPQNLGWKQIVYSYVMTGRAKTNNEKWSYINQALELLPSYGAGAFIPFGQLLQPLEADKQSATTINRALRVINASGENIPGRWVKHYMADAPSGRFGQKMFLISGISSSISSETLLGSPSLQDYFNNFKKNESKQYYNIIENLDSDDGNIHNATNVYVNDKDSGDGEATDTAGKGFAQTSPRMWELLRGSGQNKRIGETVILSTVILDSHRLMDLDPLVVGDVLRNLNNVGLTNTSKALAIEAIRE